MKWSRRAKLAPPRILTITVRRISEVPGGRVDVVLALAEALLQESNVTSVQRAEDSILFEVDAQPRWRDRLFTGVRRGAVTATPLRDCESHEFSLRLQLHWMTLGALPLTPVGYWVARVLYPSIQPIPSYAPLVLLPVLFFALVRWGAGRAWSEWLDWVIESSWQFRDVSSAARFRIRP